jgi:hypothetical protein
VTARCVSQTNVYFYETVSDIFVAAMLFTDRLCGLVVRVLGYRSRGPGSIPEIPDSLRSSGSGTGSTQPREHNWGTTWKKSSCSGLEIREYGHGNQSRWPRGTLYAQKLALTWPTSCGRSVGIVRSRSQATEFMLFTTCIMQTEESRSLNPTLGGNVNLLQSSLAI